MRNSQTLLVFILLLGVLTLFPPDSGQAAALAIDQATSTLSTQITRILTKTFTSTSTSTSTHSLTQTRTAFATSTTTSFLTRTKATIAYVNQTKTTTASTTIATATNYLSRTGTTTATTTAATTTSYVSQTKTTTTPTTVATTISTTTDYLNRTGTTTATTTAATTTNYVNQTKTTAVPTTVSTTITTTTDYVSQTKTTTTPTTVSTTIATTTNYANQTKTTTASTTVATTTNYVNQTKTTTTPTTVATTVATTTAYLNRTGTTTASTTIATTTNYVNRTATASSSTTFSTTTTAFVNTTKTVFATSTITTSATSTASSTQPTGLIIPLFIYPTSVSTWSSIAALPAAYPNVPVIAIINPNTGPGTFQDPNYQVAINSLKTSGVITVGYIATDYGATPLQTVEHNIDLWKNFYGVSGIFLDGMAYTPGFESYYQSIETYAKTTDGMSFVIGNPGTETITSYIGNGGVDKIGFYENVGTPTIAYLSSPFHTSYSKTQWSFICYGVATLNDSYIKQASQYVSYLYVTTGAYPNQWTTLPYYLNQMATDLSQVNPPAHTSALLPTTTTPHTNRNDFRTGNQLDFACEANCTHYFNRPLILTIVSNPFEVACKIFLEFRPYLLHDSQIIR